MSIASFFTAGAKRPRDDEQPTLRQPASLCAWNANSLLNRISKNDKALAAFLDDEAPDLIFVSEVRAPAAAPQGAKANDGKPRRRSELSKSTPALAREADQVTAFLRSHNYRAHYSLADTKYAGGALLTRRDVAPPSALRFSLDVSAPASTHHSEGRVICATYDAFEVLGTYAPNNGTTEPSFERRREWDSAIESFIAARPDRTTKPLIWLGDLNVAAAWDDVGPSPEWFRTKNGQEAAHADDRGQPGFTANEQLRFKALCTAGGLVDAYRLVHPTTDWTADVTWRGSPGVNGPPETGRYYNKGMRIDYVLVHTSLASRVTSARVHGKGPERVGFLGSDHCPLVVVLAAASAADAVGAGDAAGPSGPDGAPDVATLDIKALKELIASAGMSAEDCIDKDDLRTRAREALDAKR